jgi:CRP/FNR family transcriptional regulator, anaerobic regulatory protein
MESGEHIFPEIDATLRAALEGVGEHRSFAKGTVLYEEGFPCPLVPLVLSGVVRVYKMSETGREITLYRVAPGEMCVLSSTCALAGQDAKLPAVAVAETDVELLAVPSHVFRRLLREQPGLQSFINRLLTVRLAEMMMVVDEVAFGRVDLRLAELLLRRSAGEGGGAVTLTHAQLATELGSAREVISRLLKELERQGLVRLGRGRVDVLDAAGLRRYVSAKSA